MSQNVVFTVGRGSLSHGQLFPHGALQLIQLISGSFQKINAGAPARKPLSTKTPPPGHSAKKSLCPGKAGRSDTWTTGLARQKLWWMVSGRPSAPRGKVGRPTTFRRGAAWNRLAAMGLSTSQHNPNVTSEYRTTAGIFSNVWRAAHSRNRIVGACGHLTYDIFFGSGV